MAIIKPFKAIRPSEELAAEIAALPYDVYNTQEAREIVSKNPHSFLKIDRAETQFEEGINMYDTCVYEKARDTLLEMMERGEFIADEKDCYYVYELVWNGRSQTGIVACASIHDYESGVIKKHENTREDKELDRISHVSIMKAQTGPIFLAYHANQMIGDVVKLVKQTKALYDFTSEDGITHRVWMIAEADFIHTIEENFSQIPSVYIADGHHRCASAVKVGQHMILENPETGEEAQHHYFLSVLFPDDELTILDYNRVVKDLNGLSDEEFMKAITDKFEVSEKGNTVYKPQNKGEFSMYFKHTWYLLKEKELDQDMDCVSKLDVSILQNKILDPILGIKDPKTDKRIDFVGGIRGLEELERRVELDSKVAFALYPTNISELFEISDQGKLMPPKSTWFEPKLRSGLFIHKI